MSIKITLRNFKISDAKNLAILLEKDVIKTLGIGLKENPPKITEKFEEGFIKERQKEYKQKKPENFSLAIIIKNDVIGSLGLENIDYENNSAEIGYWIGKEYWGNGIVPKAIKLFIKEFNKKHKLKRIYAKVATFNLASCKVLEKCKFQLEGTERKTIKGKNKYHDMFVYSKIQ